MSTLRPAENKILALALIGNNFKPLLLGRLSTFPNFENIFENIKKILKYFDCLEMHLLCATTKRENSFTSVQHMYLQGFAKAIAS
jgi:hypothetical protein